MRQLTVVIAIPLVAAVATPYVVTLEAAAYITVGIPIVPVYDSWKCRHDSGKPALLLVPALLVVPIWARRFHRHYSRQPALLNGHYRGTSTNCMAILQSFMCLTKCIAFGGCMCHAGVP